MSLRALTCDQHRFGNEREACVVCGRTFAPPTPRGATGTTASAQGAVEMSRELGWRDKPGL
jgi:hypothetical protein